MSTVRVVSVVLGSIVLATLGLQASDVIRGIETQLPGLAINSAGPCGAGAVLVILGEKSLCVDQYEASPASVCPVNDPQSSVETSQNMSAASCVPESRPEEIPWRFVSLTEAQQLCARVGKRLPFNDEWYRYSSGLTDFDSCAINDKTAQSTGVCSSPVGVYDSVGNVWEWLNEEVVDGVWRDRELPKNGYVALVDTNGVAIETSEVKVSGYGDDYLWVNHTGIQGMIRGGFYGSESDAGVYTLNAAVPLDFRAIGVGFRCVKDV